MFWSQIKCIISAAFSEKRPPCQPAWVPICEIGNLKRNLSIQIYPYFYWKTWHVYNDPHIQAAQSFTRFPRHWPTLRFLTLPSRPVHTLAGILREYQIRTCMIPPQPILFREQASLKWGAFCFKLSKSAIFLVLVYINSDLKDMPYCLNFFPILSVLALNVMLTNAKGTLLFLDLGWQLV